MGSPADDHKPPTPADGERPAPTRIALPADPTQPIKLVRPQAGAESPLTPLTPPTPPTPTPAVSGDAWRGDEKTQMTPTPALDGGAANTPPVAPPVAPLAADGDAWLGDEKTQLGVATPSPAAPGQPWTGDEKTQLGLPAPGLAPAAVAAGEAWAGDEATQLGIAPGASPKSPGEKGTTTAGSPSQKTPTKTTNPTLDDGWHFTGRKGPLTGSPLGDFELGGVLGEGGMGIVYRARQLSLKRRAAVKVLPSNLAADERLRARFEQEARTASLLNTPHVVQVFGAGTIGEVVYFAMEFVDGTDLAEIVHRKRDAGEAFKPEEAAGFIIQAARGLAEAGKHGIVHRDIKPANLMVTNKGVVKIADFGISKVAGEHGMTMTGTTVGTPAYVSPEQGRGDTVDPRSDLYSLGVVLYELLAGQKPFDGATANALIYQHNYQEPKLLTELVPNLPQAYQAVCLRCLMKDPAQRYQDAADLVTDLERARDGSMTVTAVFQAKFGTGADEAMAKYLGVRKRAWVKWAIAAVLVAGLGIGGGIVWSTKAKQRDAQLQQLAVEIQGHKDRLKPLDSAAPIPRSAKDDLAWLAANAADDPDRSRWQAKVDRVAALQAGLAVLDAAELPDATVRTQARDSLTRYQSEVGRSEEVARWEARLTEAAARADALRARLMTELEPVAQPGAVLRERHAAALAEYRRLVGEGDPDGLRWQQRYDRADAEIKRLGTQLAVLDDETKAPGEAQARLLAGSLDAYAALIPATDPALARWGARLKNLDEGMRALRTTLAAALDQDRTLTVTQQEAVRPYLDRYRAQVPAEDSHLATWTRRLNESAARVESLRKSLAARLDSGKALSETALADAEATWKDYAVLVPADDAQLTAWGARLRTEQAGLTADRQTLTAVDGKDHLTITRTAACTEALSRLDERGAVSAERKAQVLTRLAEERAYAEGVRSDLLTRSGDKATAYAPETIALLDELERLAGRSDGDVKRLRADYSRFLALRDSLRPLDQRVSIPPGSDETLTAFAAIVGEGDPQVQTWRAKLARVKTLQTALSGSEAKVPQPPGALANASELVERWVGADDPVAAAWLAKARKVAELRVRLSSAFGDAPGALTASNLVLPIGSTLLRDCDDLMALTGDSEAEVRHWHHRSRVLTGPGKPAWAANAGRDAYGPWAELDLGNGLIQRLRYIPAGTFTLGSPNDEPGHEADEPLVRDVTLTRGLWLADSECSQALWTALAGANPSRFQRTADAPERPVERVSWNDVKGFLDLLAKRLPETARPRLPTEAEWEYACRSGTVGRWADSTGEVDESRLADAAWFGLRDGTRVVRRRTPNRFGLFDSHGNVWEWCQDRYGTYSAAETIDPLGRQEETRVARGGSWADPADRLRSANRLALDPDLRTLYVGFRFALPVEWPSGQDPTVETSDGLHAELPAR